MPPKQRQALWKKDWVVYAKTPLGGAAQRLTRGRADSAAARHATRVPAGHPEGYLEAFAQVYRDAAELVLARIEGRSADAAARSTSGALCPRSAAGRCSSPTSWMKAARVPTVTVPWRSSRAPPMKTAR